MDRDKVIYSIERCISHVPDACRDCAYDAGHPYNECVEMMLKDAVALLKEQDTEIRQLRLALDIAKGTCKGIKSGGGQFADMPTMQSAT